MEISESAEATTSSKSMSYAGVSPAKTSLTPVCAPVLTGSGAASGARCTESFASYDPATCSWRTSQLCLDGEWAEYSETWPRSRMTRSGRSFRLLTSARRPRGLVCVCKQLGATAPASDAECAGAQEPHDARGPSPEGAGVFARPCPPGCDWWTVEPNVGRVAHGVASRVDRLKALGNGQVPIQAALAWKLLGGP